MFALIRCVFRSISINFGVLWSILVYFGDFCSILGISDKIRDPGRKSEENSGKLAKIAQKCRKQPGNVWKRKEMDRLGVFCPDLVCFSLNFGQFRSILVYFGEIWSILVIFAQSWEYLRKSEILAGNLGKIVQNWRKLPRKTVKWL